MSVYFKDFYKSEEVSFMNLKKRKSTHNSVSVSSDFLSLFHLPLKKQKNNAAHCTIDFIPFQMELPQCLFPLLKSVIVKFDGDGLKGDL